MKKILYVFIVLVILIIGFLLISNSLEKVNKKNEPKQTKKVTTKKEEKKEDIMEDITVNYHASIRMEKNNKVIYFDPFKIEESKNDADYIFITHSHYDHYSENDIKKVMNNDTKFVVTSDLEDKIKNLGVSNVTVVYPEKSIKVDDLKIDVIASYNTTKTFHKKSYNWVGYNVEMDNVKYYVVGDSDITDEMKKVKCDVIFIPVGGTYTMDSSEAAEVVNTIKPRYAVPIHYGEVGSRKSAEDFKSKVDNNIKVEILK